MVKKNKEFKNQQRYTLNVLSDKNDFINNELTELNKNQNKITKKNNELKNKIFAKSNIIQRVNQIGSVSGTEMLNKLELVTKRNNFDIVDFSLKDSEIYLYINNNQDLDIVKLIKEFETEFHSVRIMEHNNEQLSIKLGDKID